jgi:hypothetical protein
MQWPRLYPAHHQSARIRFVVGIALYCFPSFQDFKDLGHGHGSLEHTPDGWTLKKIRSGLILGDCVGCSLYRLLEEPADLGHEES